MHIVGWYKIIAIFAVTFQQKQFYNNKYLFYIRKKNIQNSEIIATQIYPDIESSKRNYTANNSQYTVFNKYAPSNILAVPTKLV